MRPFRPSTYSASAKPDIISELSPKPPEPTKPPTFPSLESLLVGEVSTPPVRRPGLFDSLFGGRPDALLQDALDHPQQYDERLVILARDLYEKRKKLEDCTKEERDILNLGTIDFAQFRPPPKTKAPAQAPRPPREQPELIATSESDADVLNSEVRPYWWA